MAILRLTFSLFLFLSFVNQSEKYLLFQEIISYWSLLFIKLGISMASNRMAHNVKEKFDLHKYFNTETPLRIGNQYSFASFYLLSFGLTLTQSKWKEAGKIWW